MATLCGRRITLGTTPLALLFILVDGGTESTTTFGRLNTGCGGGTRMSLEEVDIGVGGVYSLNVSELMILSVAGVIKFGTAMLCGLRAGVLFKSFQLFMGNACPLVLVGGTAILFGRLAGVPPLLFPEETGAGGGGGSFAKPFHFGCEFAPFLVTGTEAIADGVLATGVNPASPFTLFQFGAAFCRAGDAAGIPLRTGVPDDGAGAGGSSLLF